MNRVVGLVLLMFGCVGGMHGSSARAADEVRWTHSPEQATQWASQSGRLILVSVGAEWCHYCKRMDQDVWRHPTVAQVVATEYVALKLNPDQHQELIDALRVTSYPTTLIFTPDRQLVGRLDGYSDPEKLLAEMNRIRNAVRSHRNVVSASPAVVR